MEQALNICVIDDDKIYQKLVQRTLERVKRRTNFLAFSDGEEALEYLIHCEDNNLTMPDIIFLDINMPIMDGWQFLDEFIKLKGHPTKKIVIYMVSSSINPLDINRASDISSLSGYIVKPISVARFEEIISNLSV